MVKMKYSTLCVHILLIYLTVVSAQTNRQSTVPRQTTRLTQRPTTNPRSTVPPTNRQSGAQSSIRLTNTQRTTIPSVSRRSTTFPTPKNTLVSTIPTQRSSTPLRSTVPPTLRSTTRTSSTRSPTTIRTSTSKTTTTTTRTPPRTTTTTTPTPTTTTPYVERAISVNLTAFTNYDITVAQNKSEWERVAQVAIAEKAGVGLERIIDLEMTEGSVLISFIIGTRRRVYTPDELTTDEAKNRLYTAVRNRNLRIRGPYNRVITPSRNSFRWEYIEATAAPSLESEEAGSDSMEELYIVLICVGAFIAIVLTIAIIVIMYITKNSKKFEDNEHYESANDEEIFITPTNTNKSTSDSEIQEPNGHPADSTFAY